MQKKQVEAQLRDLVRQKVISIGEAAMQVSDEYELDSIIEGRWLQIEGIDLAARALGVTNALMPRYSQGRMYTAESVTDYAHLKYADRREREERDRKRGVRKAQV